LRQLEWRPVHQTVSDLIEGFETRRLIANPEYQRGETWSSAQKGGFIDSMLRGYPVPALILYKQETTTMGATSTNWEIIDGQQRIIALTGFCKNKAFKLPSLDSGGFRVSKAIRDKKVSWLGKYFEDLSEADQARLLNTRLATIEVSLIDGPEELRDLFIRLQAGAPLTRQQIRDALPGQLGPYIDHLAGRGKRPPSIELFAIVDRRGQGPDEDDLKDRYVENRQTCAQLLRLFEARQGVKADFVNVSAGDLDALYHANTDFPRSSEKAKQFEIILGDCECAFDLAADRSNRTKFRRVLLFAVFTLFLDLRKNPRNRVDSKLYAAVARAVRSVIQKKSLPTGKATTAQAIRSAVDVLIATGILENVVQRDAARAFPPKLREQIWSRDGGVCQICGKPVIDAADAEYDHIIWYELGGPTTLENGRLVHKWCHQRGRPVGESD
jgi:hypothetical protein